MRRSVRARGRQERYARAFGVKPGWLFLTGHEADIEALRRNLGCVSSDPVEDRDRSQHIGMLRFGIEPLERWAGCPSLARPEWIAKLVVRLEPASAVATTSGPPEPTRGAGNANPASRRRAAGLTGRPRRPGSIAAISPRTAMQSPYRGLSYGTIS